MGETVRLFVKASKDAWLTVLNVGASGRTTILFPNAHQPESGFRRTRWWRSRLRSRVPASGWAGGHGALRLAVLHAAGPGAVARVRETLAGVRVVSEEESPDLLWDAHARQVITGMGDVAAHDVDLEALPGVVGKWGAVAAVRALSARNGLRMRIDPHDGVHRRGSRITVRVEGLAHPRLTVFALSGNGRVHYLYPLPGDAPATLAAGSFELPGFEVTPPFGADHVVAVSAGSALDGLNAALGSLDGWVAAEEAVMLLAEAKAGAAGWRSGVQGLYTAPERDGAGVTE